MGWLSGLFKSGKATIKPIAQAAEEQLNLFDNLAPTAKFSPKVYRNQTGKFSSVKNLNNSLPKAGVGSSTKEQLPLFKQNVLDGNVFDQSANTWGGLFRSGLNGATNAIFRGGDYGNWKGAFKYAAPGIAGGVAGGFLGFTGSKIYPEYMSYEGTGQAVMKGALTGIGLGLTRNALGSMTTKLSSIDHLKYLQKPLSKVSRVANSSVTMGAIGAASWMSGFETHFTRPNNPIDHA